MTSFEIAEFAFTRSEVEALTSRDVRADNWPVVYVLSDSADIYVGETLNAKMRLRQHLESNERGRLELMRLVLDDTFNKSVCLDLESYLIRLLSGDGKYQVINKNAGVVDRRYYNRDEYRRQFEEIFNHLRSRGVFDQSRTEIENSDLFKYSPFKALNADQEATVEDILTGLHDDLADGSNSTIVVEGSAGTGKTIVAVFLMKLIADIGNHSEDETDDKESETVFSDFFLSDGPELFGNLRTALVVPQQSLRTTVSQVFKRTPGLSPDMVLTPFQVGQSDQHFDLVIVDEAHRLNQRANQASGPQNTLFKNITEKLFGIDDKQRTQLDWIKAKSSHQIYLLDRGQAVRPADLPQHTLDDLMIEAGARTRTYTLSTQMRVRADEDYVGYIRRVVTGEAMAREEFADYDLRFFDDFAQMRRAIHQRNSEVGLSRLLAGYAWPWKSKNDKTGEVFDIELDGVRMRWNTALKDWINSPTSPDEMGSIHTVQGYDLNYAGVVIGPDIRFHPEQQRIVFDRSNYFDKKGMENNPTLGIKYSDEDILRFVQNAYTVLLTRGILGTYVYAVDPHLREYLSQFIPRRRT